MWLLVSFNGLYLLKYSDDFICLSLFIR
jgi:hypothetical protein